MSLRITPTSTFSNGTFSLLYAVCFGDRSLHRLLPQEQIDDASREQDDREQSQKRGQEYRSLSFHPDIATLGHGDLSSVPASSYILFLQSLLERSETLGSAKFVHVDLVV